MRDGGIARGGGQGGMESRRDEGQGAGEGQAAEQVEAIAAGRARIGQHAPNLLSQHGRRGQLAALGQIQQVGLVVSPHVLQKHGVGIDREQSLRTQTALRALASDADCPRR